MQPSHEIELRVEQGSEKTGARDKKTNPLMHESGIMSPGFPALSDPSIAEGTEFTADEFEQRKTDISRPGTKSR